MVGSALEALTNFASRSSSTTSDRNRAIIIVVSAGMIVGAYLHRQRIATLTARCGQSIRGVVSSSSKSSMKPNDPRRSVVVEGKNIIEANLPPEVEEAHRQACEKGEAMYTDPTNGLMVFTRQSHLDRGRCCGSRCRHCPYGHVNVPAARTAKEEAVASSRSSAEATGTHKASVYTKTGDGGTTALFTGERRSKADATFEALGTLDELNSFIGLAREALKEQIEASNPGVDVDNTPTKDGDDRQLLVLYMLDKVQHNLLNIGSIVATPDPSAAILNSYDPPAWTAELEQLIDQLDATLPPLTSFILPGGSMAAAQLHVCRSVTRRAERCLVHVKESSANAGLYGIHLRTAMRYVNRLSDFFFIAARSVSREADRHRPNQPAN